MNPKYGILVAFFMMTAFWACSDEVVSQKTERGTTGDADFVSGIDDLPDCEEENDGAMFWVSSENVFRVCRDEQWFAVKSAVESEKIRCKTEKMKDESGLKVVCDGDSVGVLQNGTDADSVVYLDSTTLASMFGIDLETGQEETVLDSEQVVTSVEDVSGFSQKGPFLQGSEVVAYELQNGRTLKQTGKQFHGRISDDRGSFNIRTIKVASQYAFLAAKGFYRNEVSGKASNQQITLNALTDLRNRNVVNINVLTHLEYDRVIQLVTKDGYTVRNAKKKAEEEIFKIFHMDSLDIDGVSEDFSIGGSGAGDAALLAISVLLQRDLTEAVMQSQITSMSESIAKDGKWNNDSMRTAMADWVSELELTGKYSTIKSNVKGWNLSDNGVPEFEPLLHHFWIEEYGIGDCTKQRVGEVVAVEKEKSAIDKSVSLVRLVCVDSSEVGYTWRYATDLEKDTYKWALGTSDGVLKTGDLTGAKYSYDALEKKWHYAMPIEEIHGGCRQELYGQIKRVGEYNVFYRCVESSHSWEPVYEYTEIDTQGWGAGEDGESRWGDTLGVTVIGGSICYSGIDDYYANSYTSSLVTRWKGSLYVAKVYTFKIDGSWCGCRLEEIDPEYPEYPEYANVGEVAYETDEDEFILTYCNDGFRACYYYDGTAEKWIHASKDHCLNDHKIGLCSFDNLGDIRYSEQDNRVYECVNYRDEESGETSIMWKEVTDDLIANTFNLECDEDKWVEGFFDKKVHFVCDNGEWRKASAFEEYIRIPCYLSNQTDEKEVDGELRVCINSVWRTSDDVVANTYNQECDEDKWILGSYAPDLHFVCDDLGEKRYWRKASDLEEELETPCYLSIRGYEIDADWYVYRCGFEDWIRDYKY